MNFIVSLTTEIVPGASSLHLFPIVLMLVVFTAPGSTQFAISIFTRSFSTLILLFPLAVVMLVFSSDLLDFIGTYRSSFQLFFDRCSSLLSIPQSEYR